MFPYKKNPPSWNKENILEELKLFIELYKNRPIKTNIHGMMFPHMFAVFFILRKLKPEFIIESGVYKGQSTWLIEKTLPQTEILSIDINLKQRSYISKKAEYSNIDFKYHDFSNIPQNTLVFFDDHQSHIDRLKEAKFFNIKHIIFEDNYPMGRGDFLTFRHIYSKTGFNHYLGALNIVKTTYLLLNQFFKKKINKNYFISLDEINSRLRDRRPNIHDFNNIEKNIESYYEFPPIIKLDKTRWGDDTSNSPFKTEKPLFETITSDMENFKDELKFYNYITYINLK